MSNLLIDQLEALGLRAGDVVMVHASLRSLGVSDPENVVEALLGVLDYRGTLMMPALSYRQDPADFHDNRNTPSCVGALAEYFRIRPDTRRSLHPTHSVCAVGRDAYEMLDRHIYDRTPCGSNSPFHFLIERRGKILMLGCGLHPNTTMHAIEERVKPPYLFGEFQDYELIDEEGNIRVRSYLTHGFAGCVQRYDRVEGLLDEEHLRVGQVGNASCHLINAKALCVASIRKMQEDPFFFVDVETPL